MGRYLAGTNDYGVPISKNGGMHLSAYVDSSFSDPQVKFHSTTGFIIYLGATPIHWVSKKQNMVALSSAEAEFILIAEAVKDILWLIDVISELSTLLPAFALQSKPVLYIDSAACCEMIK